MAPVPELKPAPVGAGRRRRVALYGGTGFIGRAVRQDLADHGWDVALCAAPRLASAALDLPGLLGDIDSELVTQLCHETAECVGIVNASGIVPGRSASRAAVMGANALLPAVLAAVSSRRPGLRFVHLSSSAVQGSVPVLRAEGPVRPFSPYAQSKICAEAALRVLAEGSSVSLRPASVHGPNRAMTRRVMRLASSRKSITSAPGNLPTPQMHVDNVAAAVRFLLAANTLVPSVVLQPAEGFSTRGFLELMGSGRAPTLVPRAIGPLVSGFRSLLSTTAPGTAHSLRRVELLLLGQDQEDSWLTGQGFELPYGHSHWRDMVMHLESSETAVLA